MKKHFKFWFAIWILIIFAFTISGVIVYWDVIVASAIDFYNFTIELVSTIVSALVCFFVLIASFTRHDDYPRNDYYDHHYY